MSKRKIKLNCKNCKKDFLGWRKSQIYCSKKCRAKYLGWGAGKKTGEFVKCDTCGKELWRKGFLLKKYKVFFCNKECQAIHKKEKLDYSWETGKNNYAWKGNEVSYNVLHKWIRRHKGTAKKCSKCGSKNSVVWANKSFKYKRSLNDWIELCQKCHIEYDKKNGWGKAKEKFPNY